MKTADQIRKLFDFDNSKIDTEDIYSENSTLSFPQTVQELKDELKPHNFSSLKSVQTLVSKQEKSAQVLKQKVIDKTQVSIKDTVIQAIKKVEKIQEKKKEMYNKTDNNIDKTQIFGQCDFDTADGMDFQSKVHEKQVVKQAKQQPPHDLIQNKKAQSKKQEKAVQVNDLPFDIDNSSEALNESRWIADQVQKNGSFTIEQPQTELQAVQKKEQIQVEKNTVIEQERSNASSVQKSVQSRTSTKWFLTSPKASLDKFYQIKSDFLHKILEHGEIPFNEWNSELLKSKIDLSDVIYDLDELSQKMQTVALYQYRVAQIRQKVNDQYYLAKRYLELLRGILARVAYEKPAQAFQGVIAQHLHDIQGYFSRVQAIRQCTQAISRNLNIASDLMSRRVTIVMSQMQIRGSSVMSGRQKKKVDLDNHSSLKNQNSQQYKQVTSNVHIDMKSQNIASGLKNNSDESHPHGDVLEVQAEKQVSVKTVGKKKSVWDTIQIPAVKKSY